MDKEKRWHVALAVGLIDHTCERVGNPKSAGEGHFGVTVWRAKHFEVGKTSATVRYVGKSGVQHEKVIDDPLLLKAIKKALKGKKPEDELFEGVTAEDVNEYLKDFDVTAKDIRGYRANDEMCKALSAERAKGPKELPRLRKDRDKILKAEFTRALEHVAEVVGHGPTMLRSQYLVPNLEPSYMKDGKVLKSLNSKAASVARVVSRALAQDTFKSATKTTAENEDEAVDALIKPSPKKKPPRKDLKKRRVDVEDPDLDTSDEDLSRNYKKVAARVAMAVRVAARFLRADFSERHEKSKADKAESDATKQKTFLEQVEGKLFTSDAGNKVKYESLGEDEKQKLRDAWDKDQDEEEAKTKKNKADSDEVEKERLKDVRGDLKEKAKSLGEAPAFDEETESHINDVLDLLLGSMDEKSASKLIESAVAARDAGIEALSKGRPSTKGKPPDKTKIDKLKSNYDKLDSKIEEHERDLDRLSDGDQDKSKRERLESKIKSVKKDREAARQELEENFTSYYAHEALKSAERNPLTFISDSEPLDKKSVKDRAVESVERFSNLSSDDRTETQKRFQKSIEDTQSRVSELEKKLSSEGSETSESRKTDLAELNKLKNRSEYLDHDLRSLELSSIIEGDEKTESSIPKKTGSIIRALHSSGVDLREIMDSGIGLRDAHLEGEEISKLVRNIKPDQMEDVLKEVDPSGKMAASWKKIYSGEDDDSEDYRWPFSKIKSKSQRKKVENANEFFVALLTDSVLDDVSEDEEPKKTTKEKKTPVDKGEERPKKPKKPKTKKPEETKVHESEGVNLDLDLDIEKAKPKTASPRRVASRFCLVLPETFV